MDGAEVDLTAEEETKLTVKSDLTVGEETKLTLKSDSVNITTVVESDYELLENKPSIEGNVLIGDKTFEQLGLDSADLYDIYSLFHS